jgi:phytoene dehydrogenase-like protein
MDRREFLNGVLAAVALAACRGGAKVEDSTSTGPLTGLDHSDDFTLCHDIWGGATFTLPEPGGPLYDCVIIGGGISGLVAAWKLQKAGFTQILVVEQNSETGGLARAGEVEGIAYAKASAYASFPYNRNTRDLYRDMGLIDADGEPNSAYVLQPPYDQIYIDGVWYAEPFSEEGIEALPFSQTVKDDLVSLRGELRRLWNYEDREGKWAFNCPVEESTEEAEFRDLDSQTLAEWATSKGWGAEMLGLFDALLASAYGLRSDRISAWAALDLLSDELYAEGAFCGPGGNGFFSELLLGVVGAEVVQTGAYAVQVVNDGDEVKIGVSRAGVLETLRARAAIYAAPQFLSRYLLPEMTEARVEAVRSLEYVPYVVANVALSRTPEGFVYSNQLYGDFAMSDFIIADWAGQADPAGASPTRPNVLTAYCPMDAVDRGALLSATLDEWVDRVMSEFEQVIPGISADATAFHLYRWGHAFAVPPRGWVFSEERALLKEPMGRIFFGGADVEGIPTIDHAMAGGFRAGDEVAALLGR